MKFLRPGLLRFLGNRSMEEQHPDSVGPSEEDVDPGDPIAELAEYELGPKSGLRRRILLRVDERERLGSTLDLTVSGLGTLVATYLSLLADQGSTTGRIPPRNPDGAKGSQQQEGTDP